MGIQYGTGKEEPPCGVGGALVIGLGSIIGGGVFATMGPAVAGAGGAAPLAFVLGAVPACLTAYAYVGLSRQYPQAGGTVGYFNEAFGGGYLSASLNLLLVVCYACIASLYAGVFGVYLADIFHWHTGMFERFLSCLGVILVAWMNLASAPWARHVQGKLNAAKFLVMGVFIAAALMSPCWQWGNFKMEHWQPAGSIVATGMGIFMSYQGFELMAAIRRPMRGRHTLAWALGWCLFLVTLYYAAVAWCLVGNVDYAAVPEESGYLLSAVSRRFMGDGGSLLLCLGAVIASTSALNADVFSVSHLPEQMAEKKEMPRYFLPTQPGARALGVLFLCGLLLLFVNLVTVAELTAIASLGFLVIYTLVNLISLKLVARSRFPLVMGVAGSLACLAAAVTVAWQLVESGRAVPMAVTCGMLVLPFVWQAVYYLVRRYLLSGGGR